MGAYLGKTLAEVKAMPRGLLGNLLLAKLEGQEILNKSIGATNAEGKPLEPVVTEYFEREAELTRDAFITFLTGGDSDSTMLHWTVADLKASLEIEKFSTSGPLLASVVTQVNTAVSPGIPIGPENTATTGPGHGHGAGVGKVVEPLIMAKSGATHGASLTATGHAYVGAQDIVPGSDTTDSKNTNTKVKLYRENINPELLK